MPITKGFQALVDEAMAQVTTYSVAQVRERLHDPKVQIVDIRDVRELEREGTVPGALLAPRGMPRPIVNKLNAAIRSSLAMPDLRERYATSGGEAVASTPEELDRHIRAEMQKWHKVIAGANIRSE